MKKTLVVLWCFLSLASLTSTENNPDSVEKTFEFVNQKISLLELSRSPNITLVVGNTGSGKSTLVHYVAGDYSKLVSIEPVGDEIEYAVHDGLDPVVGEVVSTTVSRTLVPEMITDDMGNVWYDCPGFGDTRSETVEIATTFLIKSVIENASNVKIVLVVNYASVAKSYDRRDLDRLMRHATQLIKNVDRYKESVSLVVSKAPSYVIRAGKSREILESNVKTSTANYMREYRLAQQESSSNERKIQLIDALLETAAEGYYPKISVFWRPSDAGAFNTIPKMVNGRQKIREAIFEHSSYTRIEPNDFGFPLTNAARIHITNMAEYVMNSFGNLLTNIDRNVARALRGKINSIDDFHDRLELLAIGKRSIQSNRRDVMTLKDLTDRFTSLIKLCHTTSLDLRSDLNAIEQQKKNLNILKSITQTDFAFPINDWIANTHETTDFVSSEHQWHSFLGQVYDFFAGHDVQRNIAIYNVADLADWGQLDKPQGLTITSNNFNAFTKRFPGNIEATPTPSRLKGLNAIIQFTLKSPPQYECNGETMIIKGNFVKSSDIRSWKCPANRLSRITVFALSTFFVDTDLNLQGYAELKIFAVKWNILQKATFNLNGFSGAAPSRLQPQSASAGVPGNAGKSAGNFFGLSNEMVNGASLTVDLNGGDGAAGQDGTGSSDVQPSFSINSHKKTGAGYLLYKNIGSFYKNYLQEEGCDVDYIGDTPEDGIKYYALIAMGRVYGLKYRIYPKRCCGQTGLGGSGGVGGNAGDYIFIHNGNTGNGSPKYNAVSGSRGAKGKDATKCKSAALEILITGTLHAWVAVLVPMYQANSDISVEHYVDSKKCSDQFISSTAATPKPTPMQPLEITSGLLDYKTFLGANMKNSPIAKTIRKAHDDIDVHA